MTGSGPFSASTPTADTKRDRISSSTIPISYLKPPQLYNEVAEEDSSSGNRSTFTLSPIPTSAHQSPTGPRSVSISIPAIFLSPTNTSFGHFNPARRPVSSCTASATAIPDARASIPAIAGPSGNGRLYVTIHQPPGADIQ